VAPGDSLLSIKYLDILPPWKNFYQFAVAWFEDSSARLFSRRVWELSEQDTGNLIEMARDSRKVSSDKHAPSLFYFVLRADAIDVVYGTEQGFAELQLPYLAHVAPSMRW
jgi:hypothetical protein